MTRQIFVTSYALYNAGINVLECGDWIDLDSDVEIMKDELQKVIDATPGFGDEWFISDADGFTCDEHETLERLAEIEALFETCDDNSLVFGVLHYNCGNVEHTKDMLEKLLFSHPDEEEVAIWYVEKDIHNMSEDQRNVFFKYWLKDRAYNECEIEHCILQINGVHHVFSRW